MKLRSNILMSLLFLSLNIYAQNLDVNILEKVNLNRYTQLDKGLYTLSNSANITGIATPLALLGVGFIKNDTELKQKGVNAAVSTIGTAGIVYLLKKSIDRPRPYVTYPNIKNYYKENDGSMPSGSTSMAFATATNLSMSFPKWYVIVPSYAYAAGIGYARLHLGVHYPSDVLAGAVIGTGTAFISRKLNTIIRNQYRKKKIKLDNE